MHTDNPAKRRKHAPSILDVAAGAGVSTSTVSRALNGTGPVRTDVKKRVAEVAARLGYIPTRAAQNLSNKRTRTLGAIIPTLDYSIFARKVDGFQREAERRGYSILIAVSDFDPDVEYQQCLNLLRSGAEGIMLEGGLHGEALFELLQNRNVPFVNTSTYDAGGKHPSIGFSNSGIAAKATRFLLDLGHSRVAVIAGQTAFNDRAAERIEGVRAALSAAGFMLPAEYVLESTYLLADARAAFRHLMSLAVRPTAVVCANDLLALGAILEAQHLGIDIPSKVSVLGFDDLDWASHLRPSLTTMFVPTAEIGHRAAGFLCDRLDGKPVIEATEIAVNLIVRESTGPAPKTKLHV